MKNFEIYELTNIIAIAACAGDTDVQDAVLVHEIKDTFRNGDCILFGYTSEEFENDREVLTALLNETPETCFILREDGVYIA